MRVELVKTFQFEAAHTTNGRLHGHSYIVDLKCAGECDTRLGWLIDYGDITERFDPLCRRLDHNLLDDIDSMSDTSLTGIEAWLNKRLAGNVPHFHSARVRISGDCAFVTKRVEEANEVERLRFGFESAHFLPNVPASHKCRRMHGHSFRVEVAAELAALEPILRDVYDALDRRCLNEIDGLENATSEQIARWVWDRIAARAKELKSVTVAETCTARCVYRGV